MIHWLLRIFRTVRLLIPLPFVFLPAVCGAETLAQSNTVDFQKESFAGLPAGPVVMGQPCLHGDSQHYKINSNGELRIEDHQTCGRLGVLGSMMICFLGPDLRCVSKEGPNPDTKLGAETWFVVSETGVTVGNNTYSWINHQEAAAILPLIKKKAERHCNEVLSLQSTFKRFNGSPSPAGFQSDSILAEETCRPFLESLCASAKSGAAKLGDGSDISNLCLAGTMPAGSVAPMGTVRSVTSGKCLDLPGGQTNDGTPVIQFNCHGGKNQQWRIEPAGNETHRIISQASGKCIGVNPKAKGKGEQIIQPRCTNAPEQLWNIKNVSGGYVFQNTDNRFCLDVPNASSADGVKLITWSCNGGLNQTWSYAF